MISLTLRHARRLWDYLSPGRGRATCDVVQWPGLAAWVDCPDIEFPDNVSNVVGILGVIEEMVGDIHRIIEYPVRGFQVSHELPEDILESWRYLIAQGFRGHLLPGLTPSVVSDAGSA